MLRLFAQSAQPEKPPEEPSEIFLENIDFRIKSARGMLRTLLKGRSVEASEEMEALPLSRRAEIIRRRRGALSGHASLQDDEPGSDEEPADGAEAAEEEDSDSPEEPESRPARIKSMTEMAKKR